MAEDGEFRLFLESMGYKITDIGGEMGIDNLYEAVAVGVYGTPTKLELVGAEIRNYVEEHEEEFAFVTLGNGRRVRNPLVKHLFPDNSWDFKCSLVAASILYGVGLLIITHEHVFCNYPESGGHDRFLTLSYNSEDHFDVLTQVPRKSDQDAQI